MSWKSNGKKAGVSGKSKRVEALRIKLTGKIAKKYDVWYRAYAQKFRWTGWARNGAKVGTANYGYRLESSHASMRAEAEQNLIELRKYGIRREGGYEQQR